ncbi:hypothetical protein E2C01_080956 [Portunus trituberculatus]|uniref:Uncharacterized protein n=1 Tax=Portunus trituberculatus TaxID=210409 RepID=A0A5B7INL2_PORTR|nr:hypothetical protein [Portunus trituberculatus]
MLCYCCSTRPSAVIWRRCGVDSVARACLWRGQEAGFTTTTTTTTTTTNTTNTTRITATRNKSHDTKEQLLLHLTGISARWGGGV